MEKAVVYIFILELPIIDALSTENIYIRCEFIKCKQVLGGFGFVVSTLRGDAVF